MSAHWRVGVDVGGTFTDRAALSADGRVVAHKVLSTPGDQGEGVVNSLDGLAVRADAIVHGTTVVTNLLLERRGARVTLVTTAGADDVLFLRRQDRVSLYDLSRHHSAPLVAHEDVVAVQERLVVRGGPAIALTEVECARVVREVLARDPEIVLVALLHSYADAAHERALAEALRTARPGLEVVTSAEVLPEIREYERFATASAEAYARPAAMRYLDRLTERLQAAGQPAPSVMTSGGGMQPAASAARHAAALALSGPAGGVVGAATVLRALGIRDALTMDIGGTSADAGLILDGEPLVEAGGDVAGVPIALPRVLVETVSAGGGSIAWIDDGGALRVGPRSAGARPGPVAFGRGGTEPTVTDAQLVLGRIVARGMSGGVALDVDAARAAIAALAARLGSDVERTARAILAIADAEMARALRRVSVERGVDPRGCVLVAFGGGGPLHACALADALAMPRILVPPFAGVLSAVGLALAPERRESAMSLLAPTAALTRERLERAIAALRAACTDSGSAAPDSRSSARSAVSDHPWSAYGQGDHPQSETAEHRTEGVARLRVGDHPRSETAERREEREKREERVVARMRYRGQGHELEVHVQLGAAGQADNQRGTRATREVSDDGTALASRFATAHAARYGFTLPAEVEVVALRYEVGEPARAARFQRDEVLPDISGPATFALPDATLFVADGWTATQLEIGGWMLERRA